MMHWRWMSAILVVCSQAQYSDNMKITSITSNGGLYFHVHCSPLKIELFNWRRISLLSIISYLQNRYVLFCSKINTYWMLLYIWFMLFYNLRSWKQWGYPLQGWTKTKKKKLRSLVYKILTITFKLAELHSCS